MVEDEALVVMMAGTVDARECAPRSSRIPSAMARVSPGTAHGTGGSTHSNRFGRPDGLEGGWKGRKASEGRRGLLIMRD